MLHTDLLPFPSLAKKTSFPNLVTVRSARHTAPPSQIWSLLETPPLVWIKMNEDEEGKKKSLDWFHAWERMEERYLASSAIAWNTQQ